MSGWVRNRRRNSISASDQSPDPTTKRAYASPNPQYQGEALLPSSRRRNRRRTLWLPILAVVLATLVVWWKYDPVEPIKEITKRRLRATRNKKGAVTTTASAVTGIHTVLSHRQYEQRRKLNLIHAKDSPFFPTNSPLPVHHEPALVLHRNHPLSKHRPPSNQFLLSPAAKFDSPVIAIITATNNPRPDVFHQTIQSVLSQSLQNWKWVIVDDHTDKSESKKALAQIAKDPRVLILQNEGEPGLAAARNVGLDHLMNDGKNVPKYFVSLDDDDIFELTAFEKIAWMLESNPDWEIGGFYYIKHGPGQGNNETVTTGLHSMSDNFHTGNFVPNAAMYRSDAVFDANCRYDENEFSLGGEDWDFWMCLADSGFWGGTALEPLFWYRVNESQYRAKRWGETFSKSSEFLHLRKHIQAKHHRLKHISNFPHRTPERSKQLETIPWDLPFESNLATSDLSIMFVVPWLYLGGADIGALRMIRLYAEKGYRVTVVCTLFDPPAGIELRPDVLQWTHDVHVLPSFLRARDFPRYLKHLVESRGSKRVIISNSQLTYEMLPALVEQMPDVHFIDVSCWTSLRYSAVELSIPNDAHLTSQYLHNEAYDGWKSGGYPQYASIMRRYVARTITCSHYLRDYLIERGHDPRRVGVVKLGIEMEKFLPVTPRERTTAKGSSLLLDTASVVITIVGRLDPQKRPLLVPRVVAHLLDLVNEDFVVVMIGEGEEEKALRADIDRDGLKDYIRVIGSLKDPYPYLAASDIFFLPSRSEGISIAVAEAMAMGLPVVTARAGALPEQLGDQKGGASDILGGILVDHELDDDVDAHLYAEALATLIRDGAQRRKLGANARKLVEKGMEWRSSLSKLFEEVELAKNLPQLEHDPSYPHPAAYLAIQTLLLENRRMTDFFGNYPLPGPMTAAHDDDSEEHDAAGSETFSDPDSPAHSSHDTIAHDDLLHSEEMHAVKRKEHRHEEEHAHGRRDAAAAKEDEHHHAPIIRESRDEVNAH